MQSVDLKLSSGLSLHRLIMEEKRLREDDSNHSANSVHCLRSRSSAYISDRPDVIIPVGNTRAIAFKHAVAPDSPDLVNAFLTKDFQSPNTSPTFAGFLQDTPSTLPQPHPSFQTLLPDTGGSEDPRAASRTPIAPNVAVPALLTGMGLPIQCTQAPALPHSHLQIIVEPSYLDALAEDEPLTLQSHSHDTSPPPFLLDDPAGQEVQEVIARPESPLQAIDTTRSHSAAAETPVRIIPEPFRPALSPIGKLQYSPANVASTTPTPGKDRANCVPCQCPKPLPEMSLEWYRQKYPYGRYKDSGPGNGSVPNQYGFFENAVHDGLPLEFVKLSLDLDMGQDRKQRIEDRTLLKTFQGGIRKKGGVTKAGSEVIPVDVQLVSTYHPQYCLQLNNFLPRMHELRNNFFTSLELYRHVCPRMSGRSDVQDEAIPRVLLHPKLQDNWAIALLVRFTTSRNPRSGVQTDRCFMDLASQDFESRSGNHIMSNAIHFGAVFDDPLPSGCFTNRIFPQLFMCQNIRPTCDMNMGSIRRTILKQLHIPDQEACRMSQTESRIYYIGPFYFRKTKFQVSLNVSALGQHSNDDFDQLRTRGLSSTRMQFYCQHMRCKEAEAQLAAAEAEQKIVVDPVVRALPHHVAMTNSTPRCHCGLPLEGVDRLRDPPCEVLSNRMRHVLDNDAGVVQASAYTPADKQHWRDIHTELPPAPAQLTDKPLSNVYLNIGELERWVLLRDENLEDMRELLQHDILWHFSPHKVCWAKLSGSQSNSTTPRSKDSTPSNTPLADDGDAARSTKGSFGAQLPGASGGGGGAAARFGHSAAHKRNLIPSFSFTPIDLCTSSPSTVQRKKPALQAPQATIKNARGAPLFQQQ